MMIWLRLGQEGTNGDEDVEDFRSCALCDDEKEAVELHVVSAKLESQLTVTSAVVGSVTVQDFVEGDDEFVWNFGLEALIQVIDEAGLQKT